jgi:1,5-anhydro-D-fructose reductase (1,5-anhydro-D-mannitol-forming)
MAIRGEGQPAVSGEDGVRSLAVALAALRSAERGEVIKISELLAEESIMA